VPIPSIFRLLAAKRPFYVISHERSGTHFAINTFFRNTYTAPKLQYVGDWLGPYDQPDSRFNHIDTFRGRWPEASSGGGIIKSHCEAALFLRHFPRAPVVYVIRDPRDTMVSFFHYLNSGEFHRTNPGLDDLRCDEFSEFLRRPNNAYRRFGFYAGDGFANVVERWAGHVQGWLDVPGICIIRYEDLKQDFRRCVMQACKTARVLPRFFMRPVGLHDAVSILPGRGKSGTWRGMFTREDEKFLEGTLSRFGIDISRWAGPEQ